MFACYTMCILQYILHIFMDVDTNLAENWWHIDFPWQCGFHRVSWSLIDTYSRACQQLQVCDKKIGLDVLWLFMCFYAFLCSIFGHFCVFLYIIIQYKLILYNSPLFCRNSICFLWDRCFLVPRNQLFCIKIVYLCMLWGENIEYFLTGVQSFQIL